MVTPSRDGVLSFGPAEPPEPPTPQHVQPSELEEAEAFARSAQAPEYLRRIQRNIDDGYYTWADVVTGRVDDPAVQRIQTDLDRFTMPYRQIGRWAEHGSEWDEIEREVFALITGAAEKETADTAAGVVIAQPPKAQPGASEASTPWLTDAHQRSLLQPNTRKDT